MALFFMQTVWSNRDPNESLGSYEEFEKVLYREPSVQAIGLASCEKALRCWFCEG